MITSLVTYMLYKKAKVTDCEMLQSVTSWDNQHVAVKQMT